MAKIKLNGDTSGYIEISAPAVSGNNTLELGPGTKILTNLDNTFTGITTFSNGIHITSGGFILNQQRSDTHASLIIDKPDAGTGTLKFFNNGSASAYIQHTNSEHLNYYLPSGSGSQVFYTNGTERLRINSAGEVYIGSSAANGQGKLFVNDSSGTTTTRVHIRNAVSTGNAETYYNLDGTKFASVGLENGSLVFRNSTSSTPTERLRITSSGDLEPAEHIKLTKSSDPRIYANTNVGLNIDGMALYLNRYVSSHVASNMGGGCFGIGEVPAAGDGGNSNYNNWDTPKLYVKGASGSGKFHLLGRFVAGQDSDATGAQIVIHHENDRGMALQGGRSSGNSSYGAIKSLDNLSRESNVMVFNGGNGQGVDNIKFYTGTSNSTTEQFAIDSSGRITKPNQPAFSVRRNSAQDIPHNTNTKVQWNTEIFDVGGHFDSSTNFRFTAPVAGKYLFLGHLYIYTTRQVEAKIYKNGSIYKRFSGPLGTGGDDNPNGMDFMDIVDLSVNDYIEIFGYQYRSGDTNTVSIYGGNLKETSFVGYFLG